MHHLLSTIVYESMPNVIQMSDLLMFGLRGVFGFFRNSSSLHFELVHPKHLRQYKLAPLLNTIIKYVVTL